MTMRRRPEYRIARCPELEQQLDSALRAIGVVGDVFVTATRSPARKLHVRVESAAFEDLTWTLREELVWSALEGAFAEDDLRAVSLLVLETPEEAPPDFDDLVRRNQEQRARTRAMLAQRGFQLPGG